MWSSSASDSMFHIFFFFIQTHLKAPRCEYENQPAVLPLTTLSDMQQTGTAAVGHYARWKTGQLHSSVHSTACQSLFKSYIL